MHWWQTSKVSINRQYPQTVKAHQYVWFYRHHTQTGTTHWWWTQKQNTSYQNVISHTGNIHKLRQHTRDCTSNIYKLRQHTADKSRISLCQNDFIHTDKVHKVGETHWRQKPKVSVIQARPANSDNMPIRCQNVWDCTTNIHKLGQHTYYRNRSTKQGIRIFAIIQSTPPKLRQDTTQVQRCVRLYRQHTQTSTTSDGGGGEAPESSETGVPAGSPDVIYVPTLEACPQRCWAHKILTHFKSRLRLSEQRSSGMTGVRKAHGTGPGWVTIHGTGDQDRDRWINDSPSTCSRGWPAT